MLWSGALVLGCVTGGAPAPAPSASSVPTSVLESPTVGPIVARAETAMSRGDFGAAIEFYRAAYERTPWNTRLRDALAAAHAARAGQLRALGQFRDLAQAEQELRAGLELLPGDPVLEANLAVVLVEHSSVELDPVRARELRAEAEALDPALPGLVPARRADLERRLDLAFELIDRGQLDAGIQRMRMLLQAEPGFAPARRLLARAEVRRGTALHASGRYAEAAAALESAVEAYGGLEPGADAELQAEFRAAQRSRVVAWLDAGRPDRARQALAEAEQAGLHFPALRGAMP